MSEIDSQPFPRGALISAAALIALLEFDAADDSDDAPPFLQ